MNDDKCFCGSVIFKDAFGKSYSACEHYLTEDIMVSIPREFAEAIYSEFWNIV